MAVSSQLSRCDVDLRMIRSMILALYGSTLAKICHDSGDANIMDYDGVTP